MSYIKQRSTKSGITYHLVDIINDAEKAVKLPVRNKKEATAYLHKYQGDKADNRPSSLMLEQVLFKDYVKNIYLEVSKAKKNESSYNRDMYTLNPLLKEFGQCYLNQISHVAIQKVQTQWINEGLARKTVNNRSILLSSILRMAYKQNILARIPDIPKFKIDIRPPFWFSDEQVKKILEEARPFVRDFVIVLLNTGMRLGELRRLRWSDIDLKNRKIMIGIAKSHRFRSIPINTTLEKHLIHLNNNKNVGQIYLFQGATVDTGYDDYYHAFKKELNRLNIKGFPHALRHTFATKLLHRGVNINFISKLLGHASVQTTQIYAHVRNDDLLEAVNALSNFSDD